MATLVRLLLMQMQLKLSQPGDAAEDTLKLATGQSTPPASSGSLIDDVGQAVASDAQDAAQQAAAADTAMPSSAASAALQAYAAPSAPPGKPLASV